MLEQCINQAAGLQALALQHAVRLIAMASHGRQQGELPLLWGLCARWIDMGLSVAVLDGHACESAANPGLADMLDNPLSRFTEDAEKDAWLVLPAAVGLQRLSVTVLYNGSLNEVFKDYDIVLLYAHASALTALLKGTPLAPLLVVPPAQDAALSAYAALKQMLLQGHLHPTVANIVPEPLATPNRLKTQSAKNLMHCATSFLGYRVTAQTVVASSEPGGAHDDLTHLALQLFENALALQQERAERLH